MGEKKPWENPNADAMGGFAVVKKARDLFEGTRKSSMLAPWLSFLMLSTLVYLVFSDGDFSFLLTYASLTRCFGITLLVAKMQTSQSAAGLSAKTLHCYAVVFASRLVSIMRHEGYLPYDRSGDWIYHCVEFASFGATLAALGLVHVVHGRSYEENNDSFGALPPLPGSLGALVVILPTLLFAACFHPGLNKDFISDTSWTYAMYLESFAILPQLFLFQKQSKANATVDYLIGHFVAALGFSRLVEMGFWMNSFHELADRNGNRYVGVLVLATQMVHLVIMGDFFYFYLRSVGRGMPIQLPTAAGMV
jgi:hypothetical protein|mmetsp:Transcript_29073/g.98946  ORF Transcript_29073/g.98946 Transcript_29073/m.98946 type:complete len:307 (+) Transcript_29073:211-1131(+)